LKHLLTSRRYGSRRFKDGQIGELEVKAQTYSFEAANVRHEHEWRVWQNAKLPPGKMLMPGVVSHATNLVEHPQLVADRILRFAAIPRTSSPAPIAASAAASTPTSPGRNCGPSPTAPASRRRLFGLSRIRNRLTRHSLKSQLTAEFGGHLTLTVPRRAADQRALPRPLVSGRYRAILV